MKTLHLNLKKKWFDMIYSLIKKEEYREIKPFFCSRFLLYRGKHRTIKWWGYFFEFYGERAGYQIINHIEKKQISYKEYDLIDFANGMTPPVPQFQIEFKGIEIRGGNPDWGAEPGVRYFVLKLGNIIKTENL